MKNNQDIRVLLAEDDFLVAEEVERTLKMQGYTVVGRATTGAQALELTTSLKPDVIMMDIKMPGMDGLEATRHIQEHFPTPVVILTAHETSEFLEEASLAGAGAYLIKPPNSREIERGITIAMARHQDIIKLQGLLKVVEEKNNALEQAMREIKTLHGILPICSFCKKIRDDKGYWEQVDQYITDHSEVMFSHSVCPECFDIHYSEYK